MADPLRPRRLGAALLLAALAGCESSTPSSDRLEASLLLAPTFANAAAGVPVDAARILIGRPASRAAPAEVVLDTVVAFPVGANQISLRLRVPLKARTERLGVTVELRLAATTYYRAADSVSVTSVAGQPATANLTFSYVGPGSNIATLRVAPRDSAVAFGDSVRFRVTGQDAQGAPVTGFPVTWGTTDPQVPITAAGALLVPARRVSIRVFATIPTGRADTVNLTFQPVPVAVGKNAGDNQTGSPNGALAIPLSVVVKASDSLPVAGVTVRFSAVAGGGRVADTDVVTDANGVAATVATLGAALGANQFQAVVTGLPPVTFGATAAVGPASIVRALSGGGQVVTVGQQAPQPLQALVTDANGFGIAGVTVNWSVTSGPGSVTSATSVTGPTGIATMTASPGQRRGVTLVRAGVTGIGSVGIFPVSGTNGPAVSLLDFNGNGFSAGADPLDPLEALVRDVFGNPVPGVTVSWAVTAGFGTFPGGALNATSITDARGIASMQYLADINLQAATVRATIPGGPQVNYSISAAFSGGIVYRTGGVGQSLVVGGTLSTPLEVQTFDGSGFPVTGFPVDWSIFAGGGSLTGSTVPTDGSGFSRVGYTSNNIAGLKIIQAFDHNTGTTLRFGFNAAPATPSGILVASGDAQGAPAGSPLPQPLKVLIVDAFGNPIPGVNITWTAISGGTVNTPFTVTDANGYATTTVTLGSTPGPASFRATYQGPITVLFSATVN